MGRVQKHQPEGLCTGATALLTGASGHQLGRRLAGAEARAGGHSRRAPGAVLTPALGKWAARLLGYLGRPRR